MIKTYELKRGGTMVEYKKHYFVMITNKLNMY